MGKPHPVGLRSRVIAFVEDGPLKMGTVIVRPLGTCVERQIARVHKAQGSAIAGETIRRIAGLCAVGKAVRGFAPDKPAANPPPSPAP